MIREDNESVMKVSQFSSEVSKFLTQNLDLPRYSEEGVEIKIIETNGWLDVYIKVDENATHDSIRNAVWRARAWRARLSEFQGTWVNSGINQALVHIIHLRKRRWMTWRKITQRLNDKVLAGIKEGIEDQKKQDIAIERLGSRAKLMDFVEYVNENNQHELMLGDCFSRSRGILEIFIKDKEYVNSVISEAIGTLKEGKHPFHKNYPLSRDAVKNRINNFMKSEKYKRIKGKLG